MITEATIENVKKFCKDNIKDIEGYNEAVTSEKRYCCHHKLGLNVSYKDLIEKGLYYNRPASELLFIEIGEHTRLHKQNLREETRKKLSGEKNGMYDVHRYGETHPMYNRHHTDDTKQKMSDTMKGKFIGANNPRAKECNINGVTYGCLKDAASALGISYSVFKRKYKKGLL